MLLNDLSESKVDDFDITVLSDHNVFKFEISVDDVLLVKVVNSKHDLGCVELNSFFIESTFLLLPTAVVTS